MKNYKFLNDINFPSDLRKLSEDYLQKVSDEVREEMISAVSETGGHLGAGLGVVELSVALHYVFDTPNDKLILIFSLIFKVGLDNISKAIVSSEFPARTAVDSPNFMCVDGFPLLILSLSMHGKSS